MHLITTTLKNTWCTEKNILFAGEWCKLYPDEDNWQKLKFQTFPYHWLDRKKFYNDIKNLEIVYDDYLLKLSNTLNEIHNTNFSKRYWQIVIGPWLQDFIELIFDYYETISQIDKSNLVTSTYINKYNWEEQVPQDMMTFQAAYSKPCYNHFLFSEIIQLSSNIPFEYLNSEFPISPKTKNKSLRNNIKRGVKYVLSFLYSSILIPKKLKQIIFVSSYFGDNDLYTIQKNLHQLPFKYLFDPIAPNKKVSKELRKKINLNTGKNKFEKLLDELLPKQIPVAYIENYFTYNRIAKLFFPKNTKIIFTSNAFYFNEAFKIWSASEVVNNGSKLLISQHGGIGGTSLWCHTEDHQIKISNKFYTWGWSDNTKKTKKMSSPKLNYTKKLITHNPNGDILCVVTSDIINYMHSQQSMPMERHMKDYVNDLVNIMNDDIKKLNFKYRLYHTNYNRDTWGIKHKFTSHGLLKYIDSSEKDFYSRVSECRLVIVTYNPNATSLETLSANFPTLLFWNPEHWELRKDAQEYYDILEKAGIYHKSVESLVTQIKKIYYDIDKWWHTNQVQDAVKLFCNNYAYTSDNCVQEWSEEFKKEQD